MIPQTFASNWIPEDYPQTLSLEQAFQWRWNTRTITYTFRRFWNGNLIAEYPAELYLAYENTMGAALAMLQDKVLYRADVDDEYSENLSIHFAANTTAALPLKPYDFDSLRFVLSPDDIFVYSWGTQNDIQLTLDENTLDYSYIYGEVAYYPPIGGPLVERWQITYERNPWM